jgi:hypothetical protein
LVEDHAGFIARRLSLHSSTGNHTIAECAALVYAGALFPEFDKARDWVSTGAALLEREAPRQILADGGGLEQAFWYHAFVVDLYGLVDAALRHRGRWVSPVIRYAWSRGCDFLRAFADEPASLPPVGDEDGGFALSPWLRLSWQAHAARTPGLSTFESGYSLIRTEESLLVFDHGPLGMPPSYGHGHADALSVILRCGGCDVLIDPGAYTYTGDPAWRAYFRGTRAHNTVTVDEEDQARQDTAFQWSRPCAAELVRSEPRADGSVALLARHDGYQRLGVEHWRGILSRPSGTWLIWDYLTGHGTHCLDLHWHLGVEAVERPDGVLFSGPPPIASLTVSGGTLAVQRGETSPISGWRSRCYGHKEPATTLRVRFEGPLPHEFVTQLAPDHVVADSADEEDAIVEFREWVAQASRRRRLRFAT